MDLYTVVILLGYIFLACILGGVFLLVKTIFECVKYKLLKEKNNMNLDQLLQGTVLKAEIEDLTKELNLWKESGSISDTQLRMKVKGYAITNCVNTKYINFDVIKAMAISTLEKELQEKKNQFEKL